MVERCLAKAKVAGSTPVSRSKTVYLDSYFGGQWKPKLISTHNPQKNVLLFTIIFQNSRDKNRGANSKPKQKGF